MFDKTTNWHYAPPRSPRTQEQEILLRKNSQNISSNGIIIGHCKLLKRLNRMNLSVILPRRWGVCRPHPNWMSDALSHHNKFLCHWIHIVWRSCRNRTGNLPLYNLIALQYVCLPSEAAPYIFIFLFRTVLGSKSSLKVSLITQYTNQFPSRTFCMACGASATKSSHCCRVLFS